MGQIDYWMTPDAIFDGHKLHRNVSIGVARGTVACVENCETLPSERVETRIQGTISAGYLDLQVNGGGGVLFNTITTATDILTIRDAHYQFGTYGILPTVITDHPDVLPKCVDALISVKSHDGILGIHIEGPHISMERRGTHSAEYVRPMDQQTLDQIKKLRDQDIYVMLTVAPEAIATTDIARLHDWGVTISIGHTASTADDTRAALQAGANCFTHLFNAMPPLINREPGPVGVALSSDAYCGVIVDGIHVCDTVLGIAIRGHQTPNRMFLVSDSMPTVGGPDQFELYGRSIHLDGGRLVNAEGSLAGAHITQAAGVGRLINVMGLDPTEALKMAITVPATLIQRPELAGVLGRAVQDLIAISPDFETAKPLK